MRLLRCHAHDLASDGLVLEEFEGPEIPLYAALSHVWEKDEVLLSHVNAGTACSRTGYAKIKSAMRAAALCGLAYIWIDTCCIDKSSSAELSEAVNSMFVWYENATICFAYLVDLTFDSEGAITYSNLSKCRWFTRGWCLQELVAPKIVLFFTSDWCSIGSKNKLAKMISEITGIDVSVLGHLRPLHTLSIAHRMSWASRRQTIRVEDIAYCLMGIFDVNMPLLYGEGPKAFQRLQEEIIKTSNDESLFAWTDPQMAEHIEHGLLADSPRSFALSRNIVSYRMWDRQPRFEMTNRGLHIDLDLARIPSSFNTLYRCGTYIAALNCPSPEQEYAGYLAIMLHKLPGDDSQDYKRIFCDRLSFMSRREKCQTICVAQRPSPSIEDLVYPLHYFRLGRPYIYKKFVVLDSLSHDPGPNVVWPPMLKEKLWLPSGHQPFAKIFKQPGQLSAAILFRWRQTGFQFVLLMGSLTALEVGFEIIPWPDGNKLECLDNLQPLFRPEPNGHTALVDGSFELTVRATPSIHEDHKVYDLNLYLNMNQENTEYESTSGSESDPEFKKVLRHLDVPIYAAEDFWLAKPLRAPRRVTDINEATLTGDDPVSSEAPGHETESEIERVE